MQRSISKRKRKASTKDFMIGADPEFALMTKTGHRVYAGEVVHGDEFSEFGVDEDGEIAEIRPGPSYSPVQVVQNIRECMITGIAASPKILDYTWKAGSTANGKGIGGHIHLGVKKYLSKTKRSHFVSMLDIYLTQICLLLEDLEEAYERREEYGHIGDWRLQEWGFEYRTVSSWITSPYIALGVLCLAKAIVYEVLNHGLHNVKRKRGLRPSVNIFVNEEIPQLRKRLGPLFKDIRRFELYKRYRDQINVLYRLIRKKKSWFPKCGMKEAWGLFKIADMEPLPRLRIQDIWKGKK